MYRIPAPELGLSGHFSIPVADPDPDPVFSFLNPNSDPVFQYFDVPMYHVDTGYGSSIPSPVGIQLLSDATRNPKSLPDPAGFEKSESGTAQKGGKITFKI